eukprot:Sspe_Gene.25619::Locus_10333_Transcript_1_2_Confidence_0.500_Length_5282::g.25619::m.25619
MPGKANPARAGSSPNVGGPPTHTGAKRVLAPLECSGSASPSARFPLPRRLSLRDLKGGEGSPRGGSPSGASRGEQRGVEVRRASRRESSKLGMGSPPLPRQHNESGQGDDQFARALIAEKEVEALRARLAEAHHHPPGGETESELKALHAATVAELQAAHLAVELAIVDPDPKQVHRSLQELSNNLARVLRSLEGHPTLPTGSAPLDEDNFLGLSRRSVKVQTDQPFESESDSDELPSHVHSRRASVRRSSNLSVALDGGGSLRVLRAKRESIVGNDDDEVMAVAKLVQRLLVEVGLQKARGFVGPFLTAAAAQLGIDAVLAETIPWVESRSRLGDSAIPSYLKEEPGDAMPAKRSVFFPPHYRPPEDASDPFKAVVLLKRWATPCGAAWPSSAVDDLHSDCHIIALHHCGPQSVAVVVPIFSFTAILYHRVSWATWVPSSAVASPTVSGRSAGCWAQIPITGTAALETALLSGGGEDLALAGPIRGEVAEGLAVAGIEARRGAQVSVVDKADFPTSITGQVVGNDYMVFVNRPALFLVRLENVQRGNYEDAPLCSSIAFLPPPNDALVDGPFAIGKRLPPPGVLEYLWSRPFNETLLGEVWRSQPAVDAVMSRLIDDCWKQHNQLRYDEALHHRFQDLLRRPEEVRAVRLVVRTLRRASAEAVQLGAVELLDEAKSPIAIQVVTGGGTGGCVWKDRSKRPLVVAFDTPHFISGYRVRTSGTSPECDPVEWVLEGATDKLGPWHPLHSHTDREAVPVERQAWSAVFTIGPSRRVPLSVLKAVAETKLGMHVSSPPPALIAHASSLQLLEYRQRRIVFGMGGSSIIAGDVDTGAVAPLWRVGLPCRYQPSEVTQEAMRSLLPPPQDHVRRAALSVRGDDAAFHGEYIADHPTTFPVRVSEDKETVRAAVQEYTAWDEVYDTHCGAQGMATWEGDVGLVEFPDGVQLRYPPEVLTLASVALQRTEHPQHTARWSHGVWVLSPPQGWPIVRLHEDRGDLRLGSWMVDYVRPLAWYVVKALDQLPCDREVRLYRVVPAQALKALETQRVVRWSGFIAATRAHDVVHGGVGNTVLLTGVTPRKVWPWTRCTRHFLYLFSPYPCWQVASPDTTTTHPSRPTHLAIAAALEEAEPTRALESFLLELLPRVGREDLDGHAAHLLRVLHEVRAKRYTSALEMCLSLDNHILATDDVVPLVRELLQEGANPSVAHRALAGACWRGDTRGTQRLLDAGGGSVDLVFEGDSLLHAAVKGGHVSTVKLLLERGANPAIRDAQHKLPVSYAQADHNVPVLTLLATHSSDLPTATPATPHLLPEPQAHPFQVGDVVRVRRGVSEPTYGWRGINSTSVGCVTKCFANGNIYASFPSCSDWFGRTEDLERAA